MLKAVQQVPEDIAIIGNISPTQVMVDSSPEQVKKETTKLLEVMRPYPNFILSTGCDIPQEAPTENMLAFMEAARKFK
jgi:uroporphyrinogen decarboxylase